MGWWCGSRCEGTNLLGSLNPFPGGGKLDENPLLGDASFLVELDEALGLSNGGILIEGEPCIDLSGDTAWDELEDLHTKVDIL